MSKHPKEANGRGRVCGGQGDQTITLALNPKPLPALTSTMIMDSHLAFARSNKGSSLSLPPGTLTKVMVNPLQVKPSPVYLSLQTVVWGIGGQWRKRSATQQGICCSRGMCTVDKGLGTLPGLLHLAHTHRMCRFEHLQICCMRLRMFRWGLSKGRVELRQMRVQTAPTTHTLRTPHSLHGAIPPSTPL